MISILLSSERGNVGIVKGGREIPLRSAPTDPFVAMVNMMCGCTIDNVFWPAASFSVVAALTGGGAIPLVYSGPSQFSADLPPGSTVAGVTAVETINGNTGVWTAL